MNQQPQPTVEYALAKVGAVEIVNKSVTYPNGNIQVTAFTKKQIDDMVNTLNMQYQGQLDIFNTMLALFTK